MICPSCQADNDAGAEACFTCGKALYALTQGVLLASRYEVLRPLGRGGMGRVYKALDRVLEESVAIKVLRSEFTRDPEMSRRFRSEIRLARKVAHRNVCRIYEYGEDGSVCFISMEYIDGANLKDRLCGHALTPAEAYGLAAQVADGLAAVHDHGIIHRDFKASNIMIDRHGVVKLMDFGIAKEAAADTTGITGSGLIGTPEYMSPEQAAGGKATFRSDVYSLGCVIYELFTGHPLFTGETPLVVLQKHQREPPPLDDEPSLPPALVPVLRAALAKDPGERFGSVAELARALHGAMVAGGHAPQPATAPIEAGPRAPETRTLSKLLRLQRRRREPARLATRLAPWVAAGALALAVFVVWRRGGLPAPAPAPTVAPAPAGASETAAASRPVPTPKPAAPLTASTSPETPAPPRSTPAAPAAPGARGTPAPDRAAHETPSARAATPPPPVGLPAPATSPGPAASTTPAGDHGTLTLLVVPEAPVTLDGRSIGTVSLRELSLSAGAHVLLILHPDYEPLQRIVHVRPGSASQLVLDLTQKGIRKSP